MKKRDTRNQHLGGTIVMLALGALSSASFGTHSQKLGSGNCLNPTAERTEYYALV